MKTIQWLTTGVNPRIGVVRGWKCHGVWANNSFEEIRYSKAICGQRAVHGWEMDLFIVDKCEKCLLKYNKTLDLSN